MTRERTLALILVVATAIIVYLSFRLIVPFLHALAWALALAVIAHPIHRWMKRAVKYRALAAGLSVLVVMILVVAPVVFVTEKIVNEANRYSQKLQSAYNSNAWHERLNRYPRLKPAVNWVESQLGLQIPDDADNKSENTSDNNVDDNTNASGEPLDESGSTTQKEVTMPAAPVSAPVESAANMITQGLGFVTGTIWLVMQLFITLMTLFYFFRDRELLLNLLRSLMPLSDSEASEIFQRVDDTIHATIYGSVVVAAVQGAMGGLIFWLLGLPSPIMWGTVMGVLAIFPMLGTFVIWAPAAVFLALNGNWGRALILAGWGAIAIGLIDNVLNPFIVGKRLRFHTLLVFFAILGGLAFFGASGIILGPLILAMADGLLEVWRRRVAYTGTLETSV